MSNFEARVAPVPNLVEVLRARPTGLLILFGIVVGFGVVGSFVVVLIVDYAAIVSDAGPTATSIGAFALLAVASVCFAFAIPFLMGNWINRVLDPSRVLALERAFPGSLVWPQSVVYGTKRFASTSRFMEGGSRRLKLKTFLVLAHSELGIWQMDGAHLYRVGAIPKQLIANPRLARFHFLGTVVEGVIVTVVPLDEASSDLPLTPNQPRARARPEFAAEFLATVERWISEKEGPWAT